MQKVPVTLRALVIASLSMAFVTGCGDSSSGENEPAAAPAPEAPRFAGNITDFLWKPKSDAHSRSPGTLAVLANPCDAEVRVNGVALVDSGASNGRCTTARGPQAGCNYGVNVKVEVIDRASGLPYLFPSGDPFYLVTNGCNRDEFR